MRRASFWLAGLLLVGIGQTARAQDEAKAVLAKAMKAHGGEARVSKYPALHLKAKGAMELMGMNLSFTTEGDVHFPDKVRSSVELQINNQAFTVVQVYDGKKAWAKIMGQTKELDDAKELEEFKETMHARRVTSLIGLGGKDHTISLVGDAKVKDQDAVAVRVACKGKRDISLFFDKKTHLLIKAEYRALSPITKQEVNQEEFYSDYKEIDGIQTAMKAVIHHDEKRFMEFEFTEVRYLERLDAAVFAKP